MPEKWNHQRKVKLLYRISVALLMISTTIMIVPVVADWLGYRMGFPDKARQWFIHEGIYPVFSLSFAVSFLTQSYLPTAEHDRGFLTPRPMPMLILLIMLSICLPVSAIVRLTIPDSRINLPLFVVSIVLTAIAFIPIAIGLLRNWQRKPSVHQK